jgi:pyruvate dehydrogenase E1 component
MNEKHELPPIVGIPREELEEWHEALQDAIERHGPEPVDKLLQLLHADAHEHGAEGTPGYNTSYVNTIPRSAQPKYPGDLEIEERLTDVMRWNAMATVVRANRHHPGIGGHISTYASAATLLEVGFNHFFRGREGDAPGDCVYFQGHSSPGIYARAFLEGRLNETDLDRFRRESPRETGLSSYPHPWLMPDFWQFPTVSMGIACLTAVYQARMLRYLDARGLCDTSQSRVWCFLGDGEMDEPESTAALALAAREHLDNLVCIVNCNLQRLDGPVRGNGKIITELEGVFRGAGWNCVKAIWGSEWDPLFETDEEGLLEQRMEQIVDGNFQKYSVESGGYMRQHLFGESPELLKMVEHLSDDELKAMRRGGHDPEKVFAAFDAAAKHRGQPTVILAQTIKGYGLGEVAEAKNIAHKQTSLNERQLREFRARFDLPMSDERVRDAAFYRPDESSPEMQYLKEHRKALHGPVPCRKGDVPPLVIPPLEKFKPVLRGSGDGTASTTMSFVRMLGVLLKDKEIGEQVVPIVPDEARTFGLDPLFRQCGIYAPFGQMYDPVDSDQLLYYRESADGQVLQEGISEAGAMGSFIAAGTTYSNVGVQMIPFYIFYSMFGFQRVGDIIWAASDAQTKGFLLGATAGRTTLNGEGLQHQDGHSPLIAATVPRLLTYDAAFGYEVATIVQDGLRRMYAENESVFYYLTLYNEAYSMPPMPEEDCREGILRGMYRLGGVDAMSKQSDVRPQLFGSGPIVLQIQEAQEILAKEYGVSTDLWSVTSYSELRRDARAATRWNALHPDETPRKSYLENVLSGLEGPFISASDYMSTVADQIRQWVPGPYYALGADGFGRSDTRAALRRHFEVDTAHIVLTTLTALADSGHFDRSKLAEAIKNLDIDPEKIDSAIA